MSAIEDSLRRALAQGDAGDPDFRVRIYEASERALERLAAERAIGEAAENAQRESLVTAIAAIEADYAGIPDHVGAVAWGEAGEASWPDAHGNEPPAGPGPDGDAGDRPAPPRQPRAYAPEIADGGARSPEIFEEAVRSPGRQAPDAGAFSGERVIAPTIEAPWTDGLDTSWRPGQGKEHPTPSAGRGRRGGRGLLFWVGLLAGVVGLVIAGYVLSRAALSPAPIGTAAPAGEPALTAAQAPPAAEDWIQVFSATAPETISTPNGGRVEAIETPGGETAVRISAPEDAESAEILFGIGPGVVRRIGGSDVRVEIEAGTPDGAAREFAVRCLFAAQTVCDRQRFSITTAREAFVFDMTAPPLDGDAASLAIHPGIGGEGRDIDIYSIRLRPLTSGD